MRVNKLISILLIFLMLLQVTPVFASGYENHWASFEISALINRGIVSGDSQGVRPDDKISRAEFAKVINSIFSFTKESEDVFSDNSPEKWYFKDIQIAKEAGYIMGDASGLANPENYLTRAEASVMLARILKLDLWNNALSFSDSINIPEWAKNAVAKLNSLEIIKGYQDGSFMPYNSITRAEAFVILLRAENYDKKSDNTTTQSIVSISGFGGGGGSSGGGTSAGNALPIMSDKAPILSTNKDTYTFAWNAVNYADGYEILLTRLTNGLNTSVSKPTSDMYYNLKNDMETLMINEKFPEEKFSFKVRGRKGTQYTKWSEEIVFDYINNFVSAPLITVDHKILNDGTETISLKWDAVENVADYKIEIEFDGTFKEMTDNNCVIVLTNEEIGKINGVHNIKIQSISNSPDILDSPVTETTIELPLFGGKEGEYNLVVNKRHFNNIVKANTEKYRLENNITLGEHIPFVFAGTLDGNDKIIDFTINKPDDTYLGLFSKITGDVKISDLTLTGTVTGKSQIGGLAGYAGTVDGISVSKDAKIENCINKVNVTASGKEVGGFIGEGYSAIAGVRNLKLTGLINEGDIKGSERVGGIIGVSEKITITECANIGNITATKKDCGGIGGFLYATVDKCYNSGKISAADNYAGGIAGEVSGANVTSNCYNTGEISKNGNYGGIAGYDINNTTFENCYNIYSLPDENAIYAATKEGKTTTVINCYYLKTNDTGKTGTTGLTDAQMKLLENFAGFEESVWMVDNTSSYKYPQIKTNLHKAKINVTTLAKPVAEFIEYNNDILKVTVSGDSNTSKYKVEISESGTVCGMGESTSGGNLQTVLIDLTNDKLGTGRTYKIKVTAFGDGLNYLDNSSEFDYTYSASQLSIPANLKVNWENDDGAEIYKLSWEAVDGAKAYRVIISENSVEKYNSDILTLGLDITSSVLPFDKKYDIEVIAVSEDESYNSNEATLFVDTTYASGNGIEEDPYVISNLRHFNNISKNLSSYYAVNEDIETVTQTISETFTGTITGYKNDLSKKELRTIKLNTTEGGIFAQLGNGTEIAYLRTTGIVENEAENTGAFANKVIDGVNASIHDCENEAAVTGAKRTGGILGGAYGSTHPTVTLTNLKNKGVINGVQYVGGIVGVVGTNTTITNCVNTSNVTGSSELVGGIVGHNYGVLLKSFNTGSVQGKTKVGGIAGQTNKTGSGNGTGLEACYNTGSITATDGYASGITTTKRTNANADRVAYCYNAGTVTGTYTAPIVYVGGTGSGTGGIVTNYYFEESGAELDSLNGTTSLTDADMKKQDSFVGFDFENIWTIEEDVSYPTFLDNLL